MLPMAKRWMVFGAALGAAFGIWDLIATARDPLADDSPGALLTFYGPMFAIWTLAGFIAAKRRARLTDGLKAGAIVALSTFAVYFVAIMIRVNAFLDVLPGRGDWQSLVGSFHASGFSSFRTYVNYFYLKGEPSKLAAATAIGTGMGALGGAVAAISRRTARLLSF
jgi:hypothetical protein